MAKTLSEYRACVYDSMGEKSITEVKLDRILSRCRGRQKKPERDVHTNPAGEVYEFEFGRNVKTIMFLGRKTTVGKILPPRELERTKR